MDDHDDSRLRQQEQHLRATEEAVPSSSKKRWRLLAHTISKKRRTEGDDDLALSVCRRFLTFGLMQYGEMEAPTASSGIWKSVTFAPGHGDASFHAAVHLLSDEAVSVEDLVGFNNTGNVCIWPAEEVMAYYVGKHAKICAGRRVVELGAGMTGVAGLVAASVKAESVLLTDGNEKSVANLDLIVRHSKISNVSARLLRWDAPADLEGLEHSVDVILAADCLFFNEYRLPLLDTIVKLLSSNGEAYIFAPSRSGTFDKFADLAKLRDDLSIEIETDYDEVVSSGRDAAALLCASNGFDENLHYPKLIRLKAAVQFTVGKMCEERDEGSHMSFSREFIAQLGQLTFDFLSDTWAKDLELFARHAKRTSVNVDDVKLLVRNNPSLLAVLTEESDAIMAAATVQKEQSAKRRQTKRGEGEEHEERASPPRDVPTTSAFQQPPPTTAALPDLAEDDSLDGIDWDAFDQPIATNPSDNRSLTKRGDSSAKAGDDDLDNFDSDVDEDFQRPSTSTSRPAHLDSTRLSVTNSKVSKTAPRDRSPSPVADTSLVHSTTERDFSSVKRSTTKGAAAKNAAESAPKRRSESKGRNTSGTAPKKAKRSTDNNRSTAGNSTAYDSFDDDDDFV